MGPESHPPHIQGPQQTPFINTALCLLSETHVCEAIPPVSCRAVPRTWPSSLDHRALEQKAEESNHDWEAGGEFRAPPVCPLNKHTAPPLLTWRQAQRHQATPASSWKQTETAAHGQGETASVRGAPVHWGKVLPPLPSPSSHLLKHLPPPPNEKPIRASCPGHKKKNST